MQTIYLQCHTQLLNNVVFTFLNFLKSKFLLGYAQLTSHAHFAQSRSNKAQFVDKLKSSQNFLDIKGYTALFDCEMYFFDSACSACFV